MKETYTPAFEDRGDVYGQYASDKKEDAVVDPYGTLDVRGDGDPAMHSPELLFDEADSRNPDIITGNMVARVDEYAENGLEIVDEEVNAGDYGLENDEADQWLREHDPNYRE